MSRYLLILLIALLATLSSAFVPSSPRLTTTKLFGEVYFDGSCEDRLKDENGRCPGQPGFKPQVLEPKYDDFAAFQAAMKAKKLAAADALKKNKK